MKRLSGFSLMEMMIVLTIVAIVAAASAPMVNKKMVRAASEKSPWVFTRGESIAYNLDNPNGIQDNKTARIGSGSDAPDGVHPRLYITTTNDATPHIMFGRSDNSHLMRFLAGGGRDNIWLSSSEFSPSANRSVIIGSGAAGSNQSQVIIGYNAFASTVHAVAIGNNTRVDREESTAIGSGATATGGAYGTALGFNASAGASRTTAIGSLASSTAEGAIAIGSTSPSETATSSAAANSIAIGRTARALRGNSIAIGYNACISPNNAGGANSIAIGNGANTNQDNTIIIGTAATSTAQRAIALGMNARAGDNAIAIGSATAGAFDSIAIGRGASATAGALDSIAIGRGASATAARSVAIGQGVIATNADTVVIGRNTDTVRVPGTLIPGELVLSKLRVQGDLIVDGNIQVRQNAYLNTSNTHRGKNSDPSSNDFRTYMWIASRDKNKGACIAALQHRKLTDRHWIVQVGQQYGGGNLDDGDAAGGDNSDYITPAAQNKIDELNNKISALEAKIAALESKINSLSK